MLEGDLIVCKSRDRQEKSAEEVEELHDSELVYESLWREEAWPLSVEVAGIY